MLGTETFYLINTISNILIFIPVLPMTHLSVFGSQMEWGPKVVISSLRVHSTLQQQGHHFSVTTGTCYVELNGVKVIVKVCLS